jgi:hypothetical protein
MRLIKMRQGETEYRSVLTNEFGINLSDEELRTALVHVEQRGPKARHTPSSPRVNRGRYTAFPKRVEAQLACVKADTPGIEVCLGEIFLRLKNGPRVNYLRELSSTGE